MLDLAAEGRFEPKRALSEKEIATLQAMKTGALIRFACRAGAILGKADAAALADIDRYGIAIGQAFQSPDLRARILALEAEPLGSTPEQMRDIIKASTEQWGPVVQAAKIAVE